MPSKSQGIAVSKLLLDQSNARLGSIQPDQESTVSALATKTGQQLAEISKDIVNFGLDPISPIVVTQEGAPAGKYRVLEGNRRVLALKSLANPRILESSAVLSSVKNRIRKLSEAFKQDPISRITCVVFDREDEAAHWIIIRHTGENDGVGLVQWDSNEKDRYRGRHGGRRSPGGQALDFVDRVVPPTEGSHAKIITNIQRLVADPKSRDALGIELSSGIVYSWFPATEVVKGLGKIVEDLRSGRVKVADVYDKSAREKYISTFSSYQLPEPEARLSAQVPLDDLADLTFTEQEAASAGSSGSPSSSEKATTDGTGNENSSPGNQDKSSATRPNGESGVDTGEDPENAQGPGASRSRVRPKQDRVNLIPRGCALWIPEPRINSIYNELRNLVVDDFPNAGSILFRVFIELSVDHHIVDQSMMNENERRTKPLAARMKVLAKGLRDRDLIDEQLKKAIEKVADGVVMGFSFIVLNQYVHNKYAYPSATELKVAWDEIEPLMVVLWKKQR